MRKAGILILLSYLSFAAQATPRHIASAGQETSPTAAIILGAILLVVVIIVLYRRQKRKFND
ncbi:LPXTG-motif cell wall-anchored protein [Sphingobacterium allocomposti]|uniref:LPXTG-motif cell wall-anchored protein n=1 Tax=Sphingobacterium allocomposti TaxID=415956 RepID=A0A5S5DEP6_9SPHI|nr:LPXTG-motif cell wall-anchored protein [Sphingobacterium composti Yoo et al. 2007 non Ten et al. 2007]